MVSGRCDRPSEVGGDQRCDTVACCHDVGLSGPDHRVDAACDRPAATEADLRILAGFLINYDPALSCVADIDRSHIEAFKLWQRAQPGRPGQPFKESSFRRRRSMLRMFFIRIVEWDWDDAPARVPILFGDVPKRDESLPKFLDDGDFAKFMRAVADEPTLFRRLGVELLARTGMRVRRALRSRG